MAHLLGIDVGTGGTRALVIDERGTIVASATSEHVPFASPRTGWAEQDPADWWRAAREAIAAVLKQPGISGESIAAIGFSGQMHGSTLLDGKGDVVRRPCSGAISGLMRSAARLPRRLARPD
jgi:xylulokinase